MKRRQGGGVLVWWRSPDKQYKHLFVGIDMGCEPDNYPGIVILFDSAQDKVQISEVNDCSMELDGLLKKFGGSPKVYWDVELYPEKRKILLQELTSSPVIIQ